MTIILKITKRLKIYLFSLLILSLIAASTHITVLANSQAPLIGDINRDEQVDIIDLVLLKKISVGLENMISVADIDQDDNCNSSDIILLRKIIIFGTENMAPFKVTFLDHKGNIISMQDVNIGEDAVAPTPLFIKGYTFAGWDKDFLSVGRDITVAPIYEKATNQFFFVFDETDDGILNAKLYITGNVDFCGTEFYLNIQGSGFEYKETSFVNSEAVANMNSSDVLFCSYSSPQATTTETHLLTITFERTDQNGNIGFEFDNVDIYDEQYQNCDFAIGCAEYN